MLDASLLMILPSVVQHWVGPGRGDDVLLAYHETAPSELAQC